MIRRSGSRHVLRPGEEDEDVEVRRMAGLVTPASRNRSPKGPGDEEGEVLGDVSCSEEEGDRGGGGSGSGPEYAGSEKTRIFR